MLRRAGRDKRARTGPSVQRRQRLVGAALAPVLLLLNGGPAVAQVNCSGIQNCQLATDQYPYLATFANLPAMAAGNSLLFANLDTVTAIYLGATPAQRNQAAQNDNASGATPQYNLWGMISNLPSSEFPVNASSLPVFPNVATSSSLATGAANQIGAQSAPVYPQITTLLQGILGPTPSSPISIPQINALKQSFASYNTVYLPQGRSTSWATGGTPPVFPASTDLRPYQVSRAIADAAWTQGQASTTAMEVQSTLWPKDQTSQAYPSGHSVWGNTTALLYAIMVPEAYQSLMVSAQQFGLSRNILGMHYPLDIIGGRVLAYYTMAQLLAANAPYADAFSVNTNTSASFSSQVATLAPQLTAALNPSVPYALCAGNVAACIASGTTFPSASQLTAANHAYVHQATYGLPSITPAPGANAAPPHSNLLIRTRFPYLSPDQHLDVLASTMLPAGVPLDDGSGWARLNLYAAAGGYGAFTAGIVTVTMDARHGGFNAIDFWTNNIGGSGGLAKFGTGTLVLGGDNTYTGGTLVGGGTLALSGSMVGDLRILPGASFVTGGGYSVAPTAIMANDGTFQSVNAPLVNRGMLVNQGQMLSDLLSRGSTVNAGTIVGNVVNFGSFANNGLVNGAFTVESGTLSGVGTIRGNLVNAGTVTPGNPVGALRVTGDYSHQASGTFLAKVSGAGNSSLLSVNGTATLQGGAFSFQAIPGGVYAPKTTYRLVEATGGLNGTFATLDNPYPFLQASLSYDADSVHLALTMGGFAGVAANQTQAAVANVLDATVNSATGDFANVLSATAVNTLSAAQGQATLTALSGTNYAAFATAMVQGALLFMNNFTDRAGRRGARSNRVALAEACEAACDSGREPLWSAWGGGLGGLGTIGADVPVGTVTYNVGGFAAGLDRQVTPDFRLGVTAGFTSGTQWVGGFSGQSVSNTVQAGVYGSLVQGAAYVDGFAGYAYSANRMWRTIAIPGLQPRNAQGLTGASQFFGLAEAGRRIDLGGTATAFITPFARLQAYTGTQDAFTETGAQSLDLTVATQTTSSLRSVIGAQLGASLDMGWQQKLEARAWVGWSHEYADVSRPVTATLAGAASMPFTTYGAAPQRDGVVVGISADATVADATSVYLRYEGNISGQDSTHALALGIRMTW